MKILLIHPPWLRFFNGSLPAPPIALNYIAAYIGRELSQVQIEVYNADHSKKLDPLFSSHLYAVSHNDYLRRLNDLDNLIWQEVKKTISKYNPDVLGISCMTASYVSGLNVSKIAKQINPEIVVVLGGKHPTSLPEDTMKNASVDYVVIGEGEETFRELLLNFDKPEIVRGIAYRNSNGEILTTSPRPYISNINKLPIPIFQSSINKYDFENKINLESHKWKIISARGCPFQCIYCASDKHVRYRSLENIAEEVLFVKQNYGITRFRFEDDSFSLNRNRALELCQFLKDENVKWECNTRVDLIDEDLVATMKQSGCTLVWLGIETGSQKTLKIINKNISFELLHKAVKLLKKCNIFVCGYFMIGFPWETRADMEQTIKLIQKLPIDDFEINLATPLPGTQMFNNLVDSGKINLNTEDWSRYHQGSPLMNFSEYSNAEWEEIIFELTRKASKIHKQKMLTKTVKMFIQEPLVTYKRIINRIRDRGKNITTSAIGA